MNKVMGIGIVERWMYSAFLWLTMMGVKKGYYDVEMAAYIATGMLAAAGSLRAWWVNRPNKLLDDAAAQLPKDSKLAMVPAANATAEDKTVIRELNATTGDKVTVKTA